MSITPVHDTHVHTHTKHAHTHQGEVRMLSDQLESVKHELTLEKQKCRLLEQNTTSGTESAGTF